MTRSRRRKLARIYGCGKQSVLKNIPVAAAISGLVASTSAYAQERGDATGLQTVVVTAQKRTENLQDVPLSIQAIDTERLEDLHVASFNDYAKLLPSVAFQTTAPGFARVFMRGVASGDNGNHSGPLPSVGVYLDEQPITTIQGALDIHIYDIARVESLVGPQGTLYGASSQAGTIRIITNKPEIGVLKAGYDVQGNTVAHGNGGYVAEGFANLPLTSAAAIRLVGWAEHDSGYIDNVPGTLTYPVSGFCLANTSPAPAGCIATPGHAKKNYNDVDTYGARAALRVDLNENWTLTPTIMGQQQKSNGLFAFDPKQGDLKVSHFYPEGQDDHWVQAALTVEGKISNFDLVYSGAYLKRNDEVHQDYTDYSVYYDFYSNYVFDNAGNPINPSQHINARDHYTKISHELRLSSPGEWPFRFVAGLFMQRQTHEILQQYLIDLRRSYRVAGHVVAHQTNARRSRLCGIYGNELRHSEQSDGHRGHTLLQSEEFARGFLRVRTDQRLHNLDGRKIVLQRSHPRRAVQELR
jgi:outer membrane receptor protein involved in Fe transport